MHEVVIVISRFINIFSASHFGQIKERTKKNAFSRSHLILYDLNFARVLNYAPFFQAYLYTNPLGEIAAKSGVVINRIHFSPTDHIIAFSGMVSGQGKLGVPPQQFTAPVYVYKNKVT